MEGTSCRVQGHGGCGRLLACAAAVAVLIIAAAPSAHATHFRYGHITWSPRPDISSRAVEFTVQGVWRRDAYTTSNGRCVRLSDLHSVACTGPAGAAGNGDIIFEAQGGTQFDFGDGSTKVGVTISNTKALLFLVTSIDPVNNWLFGLALDPASRPAIDTTISHTYATTGPYTAKIEDCCRISPCTSPNAHLNNPDNGYRVSAVVSLAGGSDSSPVSSLPPIVECPDTGVCSFTVPYSDNEADAVTFGLASNSDARFDYTDGTAPGPGLGQPGPPACPHAAAIDPSTGVYTWDTTGCRTASSPLGPPPNGGCNDPTLNTLYSSQVMVSEAAKPGKVAVDFLIQLVPHCAQFNQAPVFDSPPTPVCGTTRSANPGQPLNFTVSASDADTNDSVTLNAAGVPAGATLTPGLPNSGDPVSSGLAWTPSVGDLGQHVITFTATDQCGSQTLCSVTVDVSQENCTDGIDNDGDGLIDCADPDCNGTPCDDGLYCTVNDKCQNGACTGGPARDCSDGNSCTVDSCEESGGGQGSCAHDPAPLENTSCDDGQYCTVNDTCHGGTCAPGPARDCSDGNACNGIETCDPQLGCQAGTPLNCDDGNVCNGVETCDAQLGCQAGTPLNCDDGNACNGVETCDAQLGCQAGTPLNCDDGNVCNGVETCDAQLGCQAGTPLNCDDGNVCNGVETCDAQLGCQAGTPLNCDDGDVCNGVETCDAQLGCVPGTPLSCSDGDPCTIDSCDPTAGCFSSDGPSSGCEEPGKSSLTIKNDDVVKKDKLVWRWLKGTSDINDFGDPVNGSTAYTLCVYDQSNAGGTTRLYTNLPVQPGGSCSGADCWKEGGGKRPTRLKFKDHSDTGLLKVVLKATPDGNAKIVVKGKGDRLTLPAAVGSTLLNEDPGVIVQLVNSEGKCWEARYSSPFEKSTAKQFKDACGTGSESSCQ